MRGLFTCVLGLICFSLVWGGGGNTYVALTNAEPTAMSCVDYIDRGSSKQWLALSGCMLDFDNLVSVSSERSGVEGFYAPLVPVGAHETRSSILVRAGSREEMQKLLFSTTFTGLAQFGIESDFDVREALTKGNLGVNGDFVILETGKKPILGLSVTMLVMGLLSGFWCLRRVRKGGGQSGDGTSSRTRAAIEDAPPTAEPIHTPDEVAEPVHY